MKPLAIICFAFVVVLLCGTHGCGGSGGSTTGRATFKVIWPAPSRLIPLAANSIKVEIRRGSTVVGTQILARPPQGGQGTADFNTLPVGSLTATATAYPNPDGTGTAQATASVIIQTVSGQVVPVNLTMASTITHIDLSPSQAAIDVGQSVNLAVSPKDIAGNVVLVSPSKLSFAVSDGLVAGVDSAGKVTGNGVGSAVITVTDTESGKSATATVNVAPAGTGSGTPTLVKATINWAARSRALNAPASALSAVLTLKGAASNGSDFAFTVDRNAAPDAYTGDYTSPNSTRSGYWVLDVKFYAQAGGAGSVVGTAGAGVTVKSDGTGIGNIDTVGTVASVSVPAGQKLKIGQKVDLVFSARDAQGNVLALTPGSAFWQVVSGQTIMKITNGQAEALDAGTASVKASVDNHISAAADVEVDCPLPTNGYTLTELPSLGSLGAAAYAINRDGTIVGLSWVAPLASEHAFMWKNGIITDLGLLPGGLYSQAFAVNNLGDAVGVGDHDGLNNNAADQQALICHNGALTDITPPGNRGANAMGINDAGQAVGWGGGAYLWQNGTYTAITVGGAVAVYPYAINNLGQVTGIADLNPSPGGAFVWSSGTAQILPDPTGLRWIGAVAINDRGEVAGSAAPIGGGYYHACLYKNGASIDLGMLPTSVESRALALNNTGAVVGYSWPGQTGFPAHSHAFINCGGVMHDLNDLAPPGGDWVLTQAHGINDAGQIICWANHQDEPAGTVGHSFLLTPKP